jgi:hypothetical protein
VSLELEALWVEPPSQFHHSVFFQGRLLSPMSSPQLEDQRLHLVWPLHFELSGVDAITKSLLSRQHSSYVKEIVKLSP